MAVNAAIAGMMKDALVHLRLHVAVRILHTKGDAITPYEHAELPAEAVRKAGAKVELTTCTDADYSKPNAKLHGSASCPPSNPPSSGR